MEQWYISDTHFHHENIIRFSNRPFSNAREMDEYMVTQWNERVKPGDHITHLGDVTMERGSVSSKESKDLIRLIRSLNGQKRLLLGNHDHFDVRTYLECGFEKIYATHRNEHNMILSHFPLHPSSIGSSVANIHGHTHDAEALKPAMWVEKSGVVHIIPFINVSVEKTAYGPVHIDEIKRLIKEKIDESNKDSAETA